MSSALLPVFQPAPMVFEQGEGAWLTTANGERYLNLSAGNVVNALGHSHPHIMSAPERKERKLWHLSDVYRIPEGERLTAASFAVFLSFAKSGAEEA
ncbi:aminotransferase class III-fold pyridoxal phosphate-dependent enzyme [Altererythrobacter sp. FM1]|uniref:aminotransferase class III-fold pyridoxal phosphate-dependent enzyme n=1 Tax=Tsuneonella flava TaxID=2055955 RepID=UPI000C7FBBD1|nr:aminotransferase class III-fold pyridoxal phosphate-dependent enzyme [Tsuneonella flava]ROT97381.1 aminotransferase class III-fold pyridoxal phosphate-dependent enzyme [Altererythrobacter sp. FM1]